MNTVSALRNALCSAQSFIHSRIQLESNIAWFPSTLRPTMAGCFILSAISPINFYTKVFNSQEARRRSRCNGQLLRSSANHRRAIGPYTSADRSAYDAYFWNTYSGERCLQPMLESAILPGSQYHYPNRCPPQNSNSDLGRPIEDARAIRWWGRRMVPCCCLHVIWAHSPSLLLLLAAMIPPFVTIHGEGVVDDDSATLPDSHYGTVDRFSVA
jgi:hypothetical protein